MSKDQLTTLVNTYLDAYKAKDPDGCAGTFTVNGVLFSPFGSPATGRADISAMHKDWFAEDEQDKRLSVLEFNRHGESGYCLLRWSGQVPDGNQAGGFRAESGVSLGVLRFSGDKVLFHRMALVPDPA